jgi:hypothetical protein
LGRKIKAGMDLRRNTRTRASCLADADQRWRDRAFSSMASALVQRLGLGGAALSAI